MTLHEWKRDVWYKCKATALDWSLQNGHFRYRTANDAGDEVGCLGSMEAALALATDWEEVAPDPVEEAYREYDRKAGVVPLEDFRAGWMARERRGMQIDVKAALSRYNEFVRENTGGPLQPLVVRLLDEVNSGEFRK